MSSHDPPSPASDAAHSPRYRAAAECTDEGARASAEERPVRLAGTTNHAAADQVALTSPRLRAWLMRCDQEHGVALEAIARDLRIPPSVLATYLRRGEPPRWLVLALAGIAIARRIPTDEMNCLLEEARDRAIQLPQVPAFGSSPLSRNSGDDVGEGR